ncbi:MAG: hypothetical protein PHI68_04580 [Candidatus Cloacimonetes bacterium]|nr:hypothetical protein [Candidatus Cloacimonadota bacterium]
MKKVILSLVVLVALLSCLDANPFTLTGEMRVPDAYVLPYKAAKIQFVNYLRKEESKEDADMEYVPMGLLQVGLFNRLDLGFIGSGDEIFALSAKLKIIDESTAVPQVAIGIDNFLSKVRQDAKDSKPDDDYYDNPDKVFWEKNSAYLVFSKRSVLRGLFGIPEISLILNGGIGRNRFVGQADLPKNLAGVFAGAEFSPFPKLSFIGEMDGHNINLGAKYDIKKFSIKAGMLGFEEAIKSDNSNARIALSVSYLFDKYAAARKEPYVPGSPITGGTYDPTTQQVVQPSTAASQASSNELLEELRRLRESREQAARVLEELRQQLQELEKEAATQ